MAAEFAHILFHSLCAKRLVLDSFKGAGSAAKILCSEILSFKNKELAPAQGASSQFCPQKMCRTRGLARGLARVRNTAGPAEKMGVHLNLHRIKHLSERKAACAHSFPQKVCKDGAAGKSSARLIQTGLCQNDQRGQDAMPNFAPVKLFLLKSIA